MFDRLAVNEENMKFHKKIIRVQTSSHCRTNLSWSNVSLKQINVITGVISNSANGCSGKGMRILRVYLIFSKLGLCGSLVGVLYIR